MGESAAATKNHHHHHGVSIHAPPLHVFKGLDDDGRPQRTGTVWTASAHIIIQSAFTSLGYCAVGLGCRPICDDLILTCGLLHFYPPRRLLPCRLAKEITLTWMPLDLILEEFK